MIDLCDFGAVLWRVLSVHIETSTNIQVTDPIVCSRVSVNGPGVCPVVSRGCGVCPGGVLGMWGVSWGVTVLGMCRSVLGCPGRCPVVSRGCGVCPGVSWGCGVCPGVSRSWECV